MKTHKLTGSVVFGVVLQMMVSAMATPHWEATPALDAPYGIDMYHDEHQVIAKDGFVYEPAGGALYRWSQFEGWQQIATLSTTGQGWMNYIATITIVGNTLYFGGVFDGVTPASSATTVELHNIAKMD